MNREEIISANPIVDFVRDRGHELKRAGENFVTSACPVGPHKKQGHTPVTIYPKSESWSCHDHKVGGSVIDWEMHEKNITAAAAMRGLAGGRNDSEPPKEFVCAYDYSDESGRLLFQTVRYKVPPPKRKDFLQRHPDGRGDWIWNLKGVRRVLYRLPEVIAAETVVVVEGEKDADNLAKLGFVATTNPLGAGKWRDEYSETLRGKDVIVFGDVGDDDGAGERHTQQVIASLLSSGIAVRQAQQPDGFHDVSDYIASFPAVWPETAAQAIAKLIAESYDSAVALPPALCRPRAVEPPDLGTLLDMLSKYLPRFVLFSSDAQPIVLALWIAHAWAIEAFDVTPYPNISSAEKRSGKTQLLECLSYVVPKPWLTLSPSEAVLYRKTEKEGPTLLLDESDALFLKSGSDRQEYIRAYLNSGNRRGAVVTRCMGANFEPVDFKTFCPKVISGIGVLPDTVADRSIPIRLIRKSRSEKVERLRERDAKALAQPIVDALQAWSSSKNVIQSLRRSRPTEIYELSDRQMDISEPLLAIAEMAGSDWPERTRAALIELYTSENDDDALGIKVLTAIRDVFNPVDQDGNPKEPLDRIPSKELLEGMVDLETDAPWAQWWEDDLRNQNVRGPAAKLARLLKPFRIKARVIKLPDNSTARGYLREDFEDNWNRYCPLPPKKDVTM